MGDNLNAKLSQVEKAKAKIAGESSDMANSLDQAQVLNAAMDRKAKQFDKVIGEWKGKVDRLSFDLDVSQKETRNASSELFKVKSAYEETMLQLEEVRRENKTLSNERSIKELTFAGDEDRKNHERMQALIDQLQGKVKSYKKQIEEAEEIAALNLAKYRKVAGALGDAEASADANEQAMAMRKARAKSASLGL